MIRIDNRGVVTPIRSWAVKVRPSGLPLPLRELAAASLSRCAFQAQDDTQH